MKRPTEKGPMKTLPAYEDPFLCFQDVNKSSRKFKYATLRF